MTPFGARIGSLFHFLPALTLLAAGAPSLLRSPPARPEEPAREIRMEAERFEFKPSRIEINEGETLKITIVSGDVVHGFNIVGTRVNVLIPPQGQGEATVVFKPDERGEYPFRCSKVCGSGHLRMRGVIVVR